LACPRNCNARYRAEFPDMDGWSMPTHCLMRSHFARFDVQLVDTGLMLPPEVLLVDTAVRAAVPGKKVGRLGRVSVLTCACKCSQRRAARARVSAHVCMQVLTTARALPTGTRIGRLGRVSQIVRLRPRRRDDEREADLRRAFDWEGVEQPVLCSALVPHSTSASSSDAAFATANAAMGAVVGTMAVAPSAVMSAMAVAPVQNATSTQDACAAFEPAFRCAPCRAGTPCPAAVDLFPSPWRRDEHLHAGAFPFPSSDASSRSSLLTARPTRRRRLDSPRARHGAGGCVACCIPLSERPSAHRPCRRLQPRPGGAVCGGLASACTHEVFTHEAHAPCWAVRGSRADGRTGAAPGAQHGAIDGSNGRRRHPSAPNSMRPA
jgi:hypothetical protein